MRCIDPMHHCSATVGLTWQSRLSTIRAIEEISVAIVASVEVADAQLIRWRAERGVPLTRVFRLEALPKSSSGKIPRVLLKRQLLEQH
jgi:acyl-coenzyme A synthetase/AMP-(fatty) acid ligase